VRLSSLHWQGVRYLAVGGFNVGFTLAVFWVLDSLYAHAIGVQAVYWTSALLGIISGFIWQRLLVWRSRARWHREFLKFLALNFTMAVVNSSLLFVTVTLWRYPAFPSQVVITACLLVISFLVTRAWVFGGDRAPISASSRDEGDGPRGD